VQADSVIVALHLAYKSAYFLRSFSNDKQPELSISDMVKLKKAKSKGVTVKAFPFFRLPAELRDNIYRRILVRRNQPVIIVGIRGSNSIKYRALISAKLRLLRCNKQMYAEAYHIFYRYNDFRLMRPREMYAFLKGIGPLRRSELPNLTIRLEPCVYSGESVKLIAQCGRIQHLEIETWHRALEALEAVGALDGIHGFADVRFVDKETWSCPKG